MLWVTRDYVHIDRVASPWLIKRFVDKRAQFIFLPRNEISNFVANTSAIPFDTAGLGVELDHHVCNNEKHCTFDAIVEKYKLENDEALQKVRKLVRAADTGGIKEEPLAWALEVIAVGTPFLVDSDHEALEKEFPVYDAVYAYFQQEIIREKFKDEIEKLKSRGERQSFIKQKLRKLK
ncbi:MAG: chromate resistance protein [Promethearchaeota archaeon]|nr:MAG: chromate resistance protein [Candidatus Lokiarchaeota archaeon]